MREQTDRGLEKAVINIRKQKKNIPGLFLLKFLQVYRTLLDTILVHRVVAMLI